MSPRLNQRFQSRTIPVITCALVAAVLCLTGGSVAPIHAQQNLGVQPFKTFTEAGLDVVQVRPNVYLIAGAGGLQLGRTGVTRDTLKAGDHVIITGYPGRNPDDHRLRTRSISRPKDGWKWSGDFRVSWASILAELPRHPSGRPEPDRRLYSHDIEILYMTLDDFERLRVPHFENRGSLQDTD